MERAAKEAEEKAAKRAAKQAESNHLKDEIDRVKSQNEKKSEELKLLESYRKFVEELSPPELREKAAIPDPAAKDGTFLTQRIPLVVPFKTPGQLLEGIESLEEKDVFLIEHEREVEEQLEVNKHQIMSEKLQIEKEVEEVNEKLKLLSKTHTTLQQKKEAAEARRKNTTDQMSNTDTNHSIIDRVRRVYESCTEPKPPYSNNIVEMLRFIEGTLSELIEKRKHMEIEMKDILKQKEAARQKDRRTKLVEELNKKAEKEREAKNKKIQMRNQRVTKQVGRPPMMKSMISRQVKVSVVKEEDPQERDQREFLGE